MLTSWTSKIMASRKIIDKLFFFCFLGVFLFAVNIKPLGATTVSLGTEYSSNYKVAQPIYSPEPEITAEMKEQCFKSACTAKFIIKADGKISVSLLSSCGSQEVDDIALATLRRWKFRPAMLDGQPVDSTRKIRIEFEVL